MSAFAFINGEIAAEPKVDRELELDISNLPAECINIYRTTESNWLFSLNIKEVRLEYFVEMLNSWATVSTLDEPIDDWYPIEVYALVRFESDSTRFDTFRLYDRELKHGSVLLT